MEEYLRYGLLIVAALIIGFILIESWWRHRRFKVAETANQELSEPYTNEIFREPEENCRLTLPRESLFTHDPHELKAETLQQRVISEDLADKKPAANEYLAISVFAKNQAHFESYDLYQAISATGMQFGEMNIFHYYSLTDEGKTTLFSLASATKPGFFDLDKIGEFACSGLTLFMPLAQSNPIMAFNKMLKTAEQLAEDLEGELRSDPYTPWSATTLASYRKKLQQFHV